MKDADKEQYLKQGTLAVLNVMKDLLRFQTLLLVTFPVVSLSAGYWRQDEEQVVFDLGSNALDNELAFESGEIAIAGNPRRKSGVQLTGFKARDVRKLTDICCTVA